MAFFDPKMGPKIASRPVQDRSKSDQTVMHFLLWFLTRFGIVLGSFWNLFGEPKSTQIGTQNGSKIETIFNMQKITLQEPLGAVLSRSCAAETSKIVLWPTRRAFFEKSHLFNKSRLEAQLGHQKCQQWRQDDPPKRPQHRSKKVFKKSIVRAGTIWPHLVPLKNIPEWEVRDTLTYLETLHWCPRAQWRI